MAHSAGHHWYVVHVRIGNHRFERVVCVARREFVLHVIVPARGESLLCAAETGAREMGDKEFETAEISEFRGSRVVMLTVRTSERVI